MRLGEKLKDDLKEDISSIRYLAMQGIAYEVMEMKTSCRYHKVKMKNFLNVDMRDWLEKKGQRVHVCSNTE